MKHILITIIAAVVLVGCGESQQSAPAPEAKPEPQTAKAPDISIHDAAKDGNIEAVNQHLAAGTDVNAKDEVYGGIPLHFAAGGGHKEIFELLLTKGADVNARTANGLTVFFAAILGSNKEVVELLIANGADVSAKNEEGWTALHFAVSGGHNEVAELLIAKGVDVNAKDDDGETPLDGATHPNNPNASAEIVDLLRKHGGKTGEELKAEGR